MYRYATSPVGPYDELIYVAGVFSSPLTRTRGLRITNIYVSTDESIWNGRRNWNIPKHKARFEWSHAFRSTNAEMQKVRITRPGESQPFFAASLQTSQWLPYLPINTSLVPSLTMLYQPDLRRGKYPDESSRITTQSEPKRVYRSCAPVFHRARFTLAYAKPLLKADPTSYGDGVDFPACRNTLGVGVYFPNVLVDFPESKEYVAGTAQKER